MNDNTNKITDWLKQHGADSVEATTEGYHCTTYLFGYTIQERTVVALMKHDGTGEHLSPIPSDEIVKTNDLLVSNITPIPSAITDIGRPLEC